MNPIDHLPLDRLPVDRLPIDQIESTISGAVEALTDTFVDDVVPIASGTARSGHRYVRRHPKGALAVALGVSALVGLVIWLRRRPSPRGIAPSNVEPMSDPAAA